MRKAAEQSQPPSAGSDAGRLQLVYYFCRLQLPALGLAANQFTDHLRRMFDAARKKDSRVAWGSFLETLFPVDAFLACACLEGDARGWEVLFAARAGRSDRLLVDALRARAVRLYPRNEERQESAVADFWGHLIVSETAGSTPILARYDGQRPLVPWLIRTFQNWQISQLRSREGRAETLPEDDLLADRDLPESNAPAELRWRERFAEAARAWIAQLAEGDILLLGLRFRYRLSQREAADLLKVHEGTISRRIAQLRDSCLEYIGRRLTVEGWSGDDLSTFIYGEMESLLLDDPRLSADHLASILAASGKSPPADSTDAGV